MFKSFILNNSIINYNIYFIILHIYMWYISYDLIRHTYTYIIYILYYTYLLLPIFIYLLYINFI